MNKRAIMNKLGLVALISLVASLASVSLKDIHFSNEIEKDIGEDLLFCAVRKPQPEGKAFKDKSELPFSYKDNGITKMAVANIYSNEYLEKLAKEKGYSLKVFGEGTIRLALLQKQAKQAPKDQPKEEKKPELKEAPKEQNKPNK